MGLPSALRISSVTGVESVCHRGIARYTEKSKKIALWV
jgi:hypothetical protein